VAARRYAKNKASSTTTTDTSSCEDRERSPGRAIGPIAGRRDKAGSALVKHLAPETRTDCAANCASLANNRSNVRDPPIVNLLAWRRIFHERPSTGGRRCKSATVDGWSEKELDERRRNEQQDGGAEKDSCSSAAQRSCTQRGTGDRRSSARGSSGGIRAGKDQLSNQRSARLDCMKSQFSY
jgi:hypothetical protein